MSNHPCTGTERPAHRLMAISEVDRIEHDRRNALQAAYTQRAINQHLSEEIDTLHARVIELEAKISDERAQHEADLDRIVELISGADSYRDEDGIDLQTTAIRYPESARAWVRDYLQMSAADRQRLHRIGECRACFYAGADECSRCIHHGVHDCGCDAPSEDDLRSAWGDRKYDEWSDEGRGGAA